MKSKKMIFLLITTIFFSGCHLKSSHHTEEKRFRGFMIDAPRGTETLEYYFRLIDFCKEEGINAIIFRLTDDQGSAYLFTSHPELNMCEGAFTAEELKQVVKYAGDKDIEMIPEIESFGHSKYITQSERYKFLNDGPEGADFNALCPVNDSTVALLKDLYDEVAAIFPGPYIHIGCDEVNWGAGEMSKEALKVKSRSLIWAEYVNKLNGYLKTLNKETLIWGDVPLYKDSAVLDLLHKDIILVDWNYWETDKEKIKNIARTVLDKGFRLIGCPAVSWCKWSPRVGELQFKNIGAYAQVYSELNYSNNLGIILANWVPKRYLQDSQWDTYTIAAQILKSNGRYNYMDAIPAFVENHFGAEYNPTWQEIYETLYTKAPQLEEFTPWYSGTHIQNIVTPNKSLENRFGKVKDLLLACKGDVTRNMDDFEALLVTVEFMDYNYNRQNELLAFARAKTKDIKSVEACLKKVASEDQAMLTKIHSAWNIGRRCTIREGDEENMWSYYKVANYSKYLSENPSEFIEILK